MEADRCPIKLAPVDTHRCKKRADQVRNKAMMKHAAMTNPE